MQRTLWPFTTTPITEFTARELEKETHFPFYTFVAIW